MSDAFPPPPGAAAQLEPLGSLVAVGNVATLPFLAGRLPDPTTGDPEPSVDDDVYDTCRWIAPERDDALARFPGLCARVPRLRSR
ncbi:hypothetical protein [Streptomyces sp. NPDC048277]|uniref:hypothetical protein n=1 Tax=Streptomyces sp. NPDC048277 TaxID=3155027 RepID=UPI0033D6750A